MAHASDSPDPQHTMHVLFSTKFLMMPWDQRTERAQQLSSKLTRSLLFILFYLFIWFDAVTAYKQIMPRLITALTDMQKIQ